MAPFSICTSITFIMALQTERSQKNMDVGVGCVQNITTCLLTVLTWIMRLTSDSSKNVRGYWRQSTSGGEMISFMFLGNRIYKEVKMIKRKYGESTTQETRAEAHEKVDKKKRYRQIMECLKEGSPLTAKEVAVMMFNKGYVPTQERNHSAPRLTELSTMGIVEPIGKKRCSYTGKTVTVYDICERD